MRALKVRMRAIGCLIDASDVIVHLFRPEVREFYNLERVWSETAHTSKPADA